MKEKQILVIVKEPGKYPVVEPLFENTLEAFQEAVGGYIETFSLAEGVCIICNEEGKLLGLPYNMSIFHEDFVGTLVAVGTKGDEFASLKASQVPALLAMFRGGGMSYREAKKLISIGDTVFIPAGGRIHRAIVQGIYRDHIVTDKDCLFFDEVGSLWFLTLRCAVEALKGVCHG